MLLSLLAGKELLSQSADQDVPSGFPVFSRGWDVAAIMFLGNTVAGVPEGLAAADGASPATTACFWHNIESTLRCWFSSWTSQWAETSI